MTVTMGMVAVTVPVAVLITDTSLLPPSAT